ncbi:MAG TPA: hypothetical protein VGI39_46445 [Polyangiaceae bacterium]
MPALRPFFVRAAPALVLILGSAPRPGLAAEPPAEPNVHVTLPWLATQLVPSPELTTGDSRAHLGLRWQVTPVLFSWGIHRGLSPWRSFIAEPYVRQSGSIELYLSPEYFAGGPLGEGLGLRTGVRSYFPLVEHGEYLSVSLGSSHLLFAGRSFAAGEVGAYVLFGVLGAQLTLSPRAGPLTAIATFRVRYF